jgi:hypothetical protein
MKVIAKSRLQLWVSIALVLLLTLLRQVCPLGCVDVLVIAGGALIALVCALNAVLAFKDMHIVERVIAVAWFMALAIATPLVFAWAAGRQFGDK